MTPGWTLVLLAAAALLLRLPYLERHGLWLDEFVTLTSATGVSLGAQLSDQPFRAATYWQQNTLPNVFQSLIRQDFGNAAPYTALLHFWVLGFGTSDQAVRLLSAAFGTLVVVATFILGRLLLGPRAALYGALLACAHPLLIRYSREVRTYAFATVLCVLSTILIMKLREAPPGGRRRALLATAVALSSAMALLAHYSTVGVIGVQCLCSWRRAVTGSWPVRPAARRLGRSHSGSWAPRARGLRRCRLRACATPTVRRCPRPVRPSLARRPSGIWRREQHRCSSSKQAMACI
jgi:uncharacterized membrane protein